MALNKAVFQTRAKTAIVYAVIMLTGLFWNEWSFFILFSIVHFGAWYEFQKLSSLIHPEVQWRLLLDRLLFPIMGWGVMLMSSAGSLEINGLLLSDIGYWIVRIGLVLIPVNFFADKQYGFKHLKQSVLGFFYISLTLALLINLRSGWIWSQNADNGFLAHTLSVFNGKIICILLVAGIWINDTMAYIVGSLMGKTPLTSWSPKKTWEGTIGGIILSSGLILLIAFWQFETSWALLIIALVNAISGTIGDLVESKLKRVAGVKDSGSFMPGHGGFLDRFDSILLAAPAVWLVCYLLFR
jgi:phosphatidate cytidylyltransferase